LFKTIAASILVVVTAGCGKAATPSASSTGADQQTGTIVKVSMGEDYFKPSSFTFHAGETVTFQFSNDGAVRHEAVIGDKAFQDEHEQEMADMAHGSMTMAPGAPSDEPEIVLDPGQSGELTYTFDQPGTLVMGCHEEGHYAHGMHASIDVS
jgi:uncharacterized cupredoxin-like copper-binding protein